MTQMVKRKLTPVPLNNVNIKDGLWGRFMEINRKVTLPIEYKQCKDTGRIDAWKLDWRPGQSNPPHIFWDSDLAKWIEAAAYSLATHPDPHLEKKVDAVIKSIANAQQDDGYLNVHFIIVEPEKRWSNLRDCHELYCAGHLMEAAVAYYSATGKKKFLDVMCRYADNIDTVFGPKRGQKRGYPGHEEIELALVKLFQTTGEERYLKLAKFFIDERGKKPHYFDIEAKSRGEDPKRFYFGTYEYNQSHIPVREQTEVVGHAVRAMYLYAGMTDIAAATGDKSLLNACKRLWRNVTKKRMHITGGIGPVFSNEGFTFDYDLPNEGAYLETCAAIGLVFWAHRLLQVEADGQYADIMERALYNGVISGVSLDGNKFFYGNPLSSYPGLNGNGRYVNKSFHYDRSKWFDCACCPPNLARIIAQFPLYVYSTKRNEVYIHLYARNTAVLEIAGQTVEIVQKTDYPWKEKVAITVNPKNTGTWTLALRIPGWCNGAKLKINGKPLLIPPLVQKGYARIRRTWNRGDKIELILPMLPVRIEAHPKARQDCGRIALQRGPLVYCLEEVDNGKYLNDIALPRDSRLLVKNEPTTIGTVPFVLAKARRRDTGNWQHTLYRPAINRMKSTTLKALPYFMWANRKHGEMLVWIRES